jgi:hypothetical protein
MNSLDLLLSVFCDKDRSNFAKFDSDAVNHGRLHHHFISSAPDSPRSRDSFGSRRTFITPLTHLSASLLVDVLILTQNFCRY